MKQTIHKAAVLGAGVMGAQIAAHLANAGIQTLLFDLGSEGKLSNRIAVEALGHLKKLKPAPLANEAVLNYLTPCDYDHHLEQLKDCDFVIEAIAERMDFKKSLYERIAPFLGPDVILASNTSGLPINQLAESLPTQLKSRFLGVHFFNPPRYMRLVELIASSQTDMRILDTLETFFVTYLGKGVVRAKDTPNFIGNRIGVFALLAALKHAEDYGLEPDVVDILTGPLLGRPKSATFRTLDVVGLDTLKHVVTTFQKQLAEDPWYAYFKLPNWLEGLIAKGALGQKNGKGVYQKTAQGIMVYHWPSQEYRPAGAKADPEVIAILKNPDPTDRLYALRNHTSKQAQFLWATLRDIYHYSAYHLAEIAETVRDVDLVMRWGFGWTHGPFESWQMMGWQEVAKAIAADKNAVAVPLPAWVVTLETGPYHQATAYAPQVKTGVQRSTLPVYKRQIHFDTVLGETLEEGKTVFETEEARLWHQDDGIAIFSPKTKNNTLSIGVVEALIESVAVAEKDFQALILYPRGENFSFGANLKEALGALQQNRVELLAKAVGNFQIASQKLWYAKVPTIAVVKGRTLGGGCELAMHCHKRVCAFETYMGLVEAGVGLLPAGGGSLFFSRKVSQQWPVAVLSALGHYFEKMAKAQVTMSAADLVGFGFADHTDPIVFHSDEGLFVAKEQAKALIQAAIPARLPHPFAVQGSRGMGFLYSVILNLQEGGFISAHDALIAQKIATVLCGGDVPAGTIVTDADILALEREHFIDLFKSAKTQARIASLIETGQILRN